MAWSTAHEHGRYQAALQLRQLAAFRAPTLRAGLRCCGLRDCPQLRGEAVGGSFDRDTATVAMPMRTASPAC